jgi:Mn-dependent DtxR family transcriptional regulator
MTLHVSAQPATTIPPFVRVLRCADRAMLDVARRHRLRPMEAYLLLLLLELEPAPTQTLALRVAASPSQAKQLALALQARGFAERQPHTGMTAITEAGREAGIVLAAELHEAFRVRVAPLDPIETWRTLEV